MILLSVTSIDFKIMNSSGNMTWFCVPEKCCNKISWFLEKYFKKNKVLSDKELNFLFFLKCSILPFSLLWSFHCLLSFTFIFTYWFPDKYRSKVHSFRSTEDPPHRCDQNEYFNSCGRVCEKTCLTKNQKHCQLSCNPPQCTCKEGFVRDKLRCIPAEQCNRSSWVNTGRKFLIYKYVIFVNFLL